MENIDQNPKNGKSFGDIIAESLVTKPNATTTPTGKPSGTGYFPDTPNPPNLPQMAPAPKPLDLDAVKVTCTIVKADYPQTKTIAINEDGSFKKSNPPGLSSGLAQKLELRGTPLEVLSLLGGRLEKLKDTEVLIPAPFNYSGLSCVELRTQGELRPGSNFIARTHQFFRPDEGAALFFFDIDTKDFPQEIRAMVEAEGDLTAAYVKVFPALGTAARLSRMSASAGWRNRETGLGYGDQAGQHRYYVVKDGRKIGAFSQTLFNRLVLAGYGFTFVAENGAIYIRTIFDMAASRDTARLAYEADAVLADERLERVPEERKCHLTGAGLLDTDELRELSEDEKARLKEIVADLKQRAQPKAEQKKAAYRGERIKEYVAKGMTPQNAAATADAALDLRLTGDFSVRLDDGEVVTVAQMFADPDKYDGKTCADPIEPEYGSGRNLAKIYLKNGSPNIFSHAHGGITYRLDRLPGDYGLTAVAEIDEHVAVSAEEARPKENSAQAIFERFAPTTFVPKPPSEYAQPDWLYGTVHQRGYCNITVASSGIGKSSLTLVEAVAMASGKQLLDVKPQGKLRVWVWNGEDDREALGRRIAAAMLHHGITAEDIGDRLMVDSGFDMPIVMGKSTRGAAEILETHAQALTEALKSRNVDVLIADPFVSTHGVPENDNVAMDLVSKRWAKIAYEAQVSIGFVHHSRKSKEEETTIEDSRGASSFLAAMRGGRALSRMSKKEGDRLGVGDRYWTLFRKTGLDKTTHAPLGDPESATWYQITSVPLGNGNGSGLEAILTGTYVGVVTLWNGMATSGLMSQPDTMDVALEALKGGAWRDDARADAWVGKPIATALNLDHEADRAEIRGIITRLKRAGRLRMVRGKDDKRNPRWFVEPVFPDKVSAPTSDNGVFD